MAKREPLDARTLRAVANQLLSASRYLMRKAKHPAEGYVCAYSWAHGLRAEARRIERAAKATKLTPATTLCGPHERARKRTP